ncbi:hypothetical protein [Clostridium sp. C2-6-12]|uniref:hypothetical protein n=1 Tax=Clostridium sp. C2-6-12 TaxID=2698832 RepID=UPI0013691B4A|nr:hypothetical protein [Clostridium sp. C2-6-12]
MNLCYIENNFKHLNLLKEFVKRNINIKGIKCLKELESEDLLVISSEYPNYEQLVKGFPNIIVWENIYQKFYDYSVNKYLTNYDFYHLKYSLKKALKPNIESIVVGSSYALFGVEESIINSPCVNLALASQDLYYGTLIGQHVINNNKNIKNVFIGTGYYYFYNDLSLTQGGEIMRIADVYYPIFRDVHNCKDLPLSQKAILYEEEIFDVERIVDSFCSAFYEERNGRYFIEGRDRFELRMVLRGSWNQKWFELEDNLQEESAFERANSHNKAIKYVDSYKENREILNSFVKFCNERKVNVYLLAFPSTKYYKKYLLKDFQESYLSAVNSIDGELKFIDFNDLDIFDNKDFVDMDHLDKSGATKISDYINNLKL